MKKERPKNNKTNLGIKVDIDLWNEFRKRAIDEEEKTGTLLENIIRDYLDLPDEVPENETSENEPENEPSEPKSNRPSRRDFDRDKSTLEEDEDPSVLSEAEAEARFRGNKR